jgi:hypothetical protein
MTVVRLMCIMKYIPASYFSPYMEASGITGSYYEHALHSVPCGACVRGARSLAVSRLVDTVTLGDNF